MTGTVFQRSGRLPAWQKLLLLCCLFAAGAQQLAVQTHWHNAAAAAAHVASAPASAPASPLHGQSGHDDCLLCQIAAHTGAAAPPAVAVSLTRVADLFHVRPPPADHVVAVVLPAHAWHSRGPPST